MNLSTNVVSQPALTQTPTSAQTMSANVNRPHPEGDSHAALVSHPCGCREVNEAYIRDVSRVPFKLPPQSVAHKSTHATFMCCACGAMIYHAQGGE
jgi:hypothetical protein